MSLSAFFFDVWLLCAVLDMSIRVLVGSLLYACRVLVIVCSVPIIAARSEIGSELTISRGFHTSNRNMSTLRVVDASSEEMQSERGTSCCSCGGLKCGTDASDAVARGLSAFPVDV